MLGLLAAGFVAALAAPLFGGRRDERDVARGLAGDSAQGFRLVAFAATPAWLAGLLAVVPGLEPLRALSLWSLALLYAGLPRLMRCGEGSAAAGLLRAGRPRPRADRLGLGRTAPAPRGAGAVNAASRPREPAPARARPAETSAVTRGGDAPPARSRLRLHGRGVAALRTARGHPRARPRWRIAHRRGEILRGGLPGRFQVGRLRRVVRPVRVSPCRAISRSSYFPSMRG